MAEPLRHRQTKEAETDMFSLKPPRHISTLPRLCEKSEVQFGFRTSVSVSLDLKTNRATNCRRETATKKTILRFFCRCDFSHSLGPSRRLVATHRFGRYWRVGSTDQCNTARSLSAGVSKPKVFRGR